MKRLLDSSDSSELERTVLEYGVTERPAEVARARILASLGTAAAVTLSRASAASTATTANAGSAAISVSNTTLALSLLKVTVFAVATGTSSAVVHHAIANEPSAVRAESHIAASTVRLRGETLTPFPAPSPASPRPEDAAQFNQEIAGSPPRSRLVEPQTKAVPRRSTSRTDLAEPTPNVASEWETTAPKASLADEVRLLDEASASAGSGDFAASLRLLDEHAALAGHVLAPEATLLRIEVLLKLGNRTAALETARRAVQGTNQSHAARIRRMFPGEAIP